MYSVVFVCLGNICRSPAAEAVLQAIVDKEGLSDQILVDSCGTSSHHTGEKADHRMAVHAEKRGYTVDHTARGFSKEKDFQLFDIIVAMDNQNYSDLQALAPSDQHSKKIHKFVSYCKKISAEEVSDPYYGGPQDFENTLDLIEDGCQTLISEIRAQLFNSSSY